MKKLGLIVATLIFSASALADDANNDVHPSITVAASPAGSEMLWELPEKTDGEREKRALQDLEYRAKVLNDRVDTELNSRLDEKLNQQLNADF
ncbi:hypothetical protein [Marinimicrobium sp. C2-29]|uniref:hypothetical protein n=1 Tax=Marinimicrobium sp. C2-29 TaxID=3139825 RepID=UPI00313955B2